MLLSLCRNPNPAATAMAQPERLPAAPYRQEADAAKTSDHDEDQHRGSTINTIGESGSTQYQVLICHAGELLPQLIMLQYGRFCIVNTPSAAPGYDITHTWRAR